MRSPLGLSRRVPPASHVFLAMVCLVVSLILLWLTYDNMRKGEASVSVRWALWGKNKFRRDADPGPFGSSQSSTLLWESRESGSPLPNSSILRAIVRSLRISIRSNPWFLVLNEMNSSHFTTSSVMKAALVFCLVVLGTYPAFAHRDLQAKSPRQNSSLRVEIKSCSP